jgi:uncharacterized OsmC-like protein
MPNATPLLTRTEVRVAYGLACEVELGDRSLRVDLPVAEGGTATGPHPDQLLRAGLGAGLVLGYRSWAARLGVALDDVRLVLECEQGPHGFAGGWRRVCIDVTFVTAAPEGDVQRVVEAAHRASPVLANLSRDVAREIRVRVAEVPAKERPVPPQVTPLGAQPDAGAKDNPVR